MVSCLSRRDPLTRWSSICASGISRISQTPEYLRSNGGSTIIVGGKPSSIQVSGANADDFIDLGRVVAGGASGNDGRDFLRADFSDFTESGDVGVGDDTHYFGDFRIARFEQFDVSGGSGNDWLDGGRYEDTLRGGAGQDDVMGGGSNDVLDGGAGADRISGNSGNDSLTGGSGIDPLSGDAGNDTLDGGSGVDMLDGGAGDDVYHVGNRRDVVFEEASEGHDTVLASVSWTLDEDFEELALVGSANLNGTGNKLANVLLGNAGANTLGGRFGKDTITAGASRDTFVFDTKLAKANVDTITDFKHNKDTLALDDAIVAAIGSSLSAGEFYAKSGATKAHDRSDRIIYDTKTGKLFYDDDGNRSGGHAPIHFATLSSKPILDHGDFAIV
jgi:hypothetical protein